MKCSLALVLLFTFLVPTYAQLKYPDTKKVSQEDDYYGKKIQDPYRWLENDTSEETRAWVAEQAKVTRAYLEAIPFRHGLKKQIAAYYNYPRFSSPYRNGPYHYYYRNDGLQNFSVLYRQLGPADTSELVIDPNKLSTDGSIEMTGFVASKDGRYGAWMISKAGSDWQTIRVRDLQTMTDLDDSLTWVKESDIAWQGNGFYYSRYPEPARGSELSSQNKNQQLWFHVVGTSQSQDRLVYEDTLRPFRFYYASTSEDERFVFLSIVERVQKGYEGNALWYLDNSASDKKFKPIVAEPGEFVYGVVDPVGDKLLIQTNDHAPNSRIILFDPAAPSRKNWKTVVAEKREPIQLATLGGGQLFLKYLKDATSKIVVHRTDGKFIREIGLPGPGDAEVFRAPMDDTLVFYTYRSLNYPTHIFQYNTKTGKSTIFRKPEILFNPDDYVTSQKFFQSKDGTRVSMFMVHRKGIKRNGKNPTLMYGYGGFSYSPGLPFTASVMPWLERGGIYVIVNLRGGGEYGEEWHKSGMLHKKQRVFDDFIAAAEYLIDRKYTSSNFLAARGSSNGGLLVAAVINQRPDLFAAAIPEVGVMDMLRFQKFTIGWNWIAEYGSSENENDFTNLVAYSPLHNIQADVEYPATLVITADHDDRVVPAHSYKYIATLQEKYNGNNPTLLKIETNTGHGLSSIVKNIELAADIYSFILFNMGVEWKGLETEEK